MLRFSILLLPLAACEPASSTETGDSASDTGDTHQPEETGETGNSTLTASLNGTVLDPDGSPIQGVRTNVCRDLCKTAMTAADGTYEFAALEPWTAAYYVAPNSDLGYATAYAPITWQDNEEKTIDIQLLTLGDTVNAKGGGDFWFDSGLYVSVDADGMLDALSGAAVDSITATMATPEALPPIEVSETVVAAWYLAPFEAHGNASVSAMNNWNIPEGATVTVWWAETPQSAGWVNGGTLTAGPEGEEMTYNGAGIGAFTAVVLTTP